MTKTCRHTKIGQESLLLDKSGVIQFSQSIKVVRLLDSTDFTDVLW